MDVDLVNMFRVEIWPFNKLGIRYDDSSYSCDKSALFLHNFFDGILYQIVQLKFVNFNGSHRATLADSTDD